MGFTNWIRSRFFRPGGLQFFTWSGEGCSPGFTVDLRSLYGITAAYNHCSTLKTVVNRNAMIRITMYWIVILTCKGCLPGPIRCKRGRSC